MDLHLIKHMPDVNSIMDYFSNVDKFLDKKINICIIGGSFFVLSRLKPATPDIDMIVEERAYDDMIKIKDRLKTKFKVDILTDRWTGDMQLPRNYMKRARRYRRYRRKFPHIRLWTLSIYDMIITKINRWNKKDIEDINTMMSKFNIYRRRFEKRVNKYPNKDRLRKNLNEFYHIFDSKLKWSLF